MFTLMEKYRDIPIIMDEYNDVHVKSQPFFRRQRFGEKRYSLEGTGVPKTRELNLAGLKLIKGRITGHICAWRLDKGFQIVARSELAGVGNGMSA